jgi:hypothetical protein
VAGVAKVRIDGLEIDQDLDFQRRSWIVQRIGWALMFLIVLAAVLGLLGPGRLSHGRADAPGAMSVEYQRLSLYETPDTLTVRLEPAVTAQDTVRVALDRGFLDSAKMTSVLPPPVRVEAAAGRLVYVFAVAERGTPMTITFGFEPQVIGPRRGVVALEGAPAGGSVTFRQFVYP